jgi:glycosyltransferase involved in cell wall biosynthesis
MFYNKKPKQKGIEDGITAFEIARKKYPHLELWMVGKKRESWLPSYIQFWKGLNQEMLVNFYRSIDIFLYPSHLDACALPPMEATACKCALVSTDVGGISDFTIPNKTALVSAPKYIEGLARNIISLVENPETLKELSLAGYKKIKEFSWEHQTRALEEILKNLKNNNEDSIS